MTLDQRTPAAAAPPGRRARSRGASARSPAGAGSCPPDRVLAEMAQLGLTATELGPLGYLPLEPGALRARLAEYGLALVGGFVPLVLHERSLDDARAPRTRSPPRSTRPAATCSSPSR